MVVKVLRRNKVISSQFFNDFDKAMDFALAQGWRGCHCIVLRKYDAKRWCKTYLIPPETL